MTTHLDRSTIDPYLARTLDGSALRRFDAHVAGCLSCTLAVESSALDEARWERRGPLARLVRVEPGEAVALRDADGVERAA